MNLLLDSTLKASIILVAALGATVLLRKRSAALRHWVLSVAVGCALAAPLLAFVVPSWQIDAGALLPQPSAESTRVATPSETATAGDSVAVQSEHSATTPPDTPAAQRSVEVARLAGFIWLTGSALSLLVLGTGMARLARVASASSRIDVGRAAAMTEEISARLGLSRPVTLLQTERPNLLVTWGLLRPRVLLPVSWHGWAEDRVRVVISHELAHIQRGDWIVQIAAEILRSVYWFNPLVWIACRRLRVESEHACDDAVLNGGVAGSEYAQHLLDLARLLKARRRALLPDLPAPAMARPSSLEGRVTAMLNVSLNRAPVSRRARTLTVAALLALTIPLAAFAQPTFYSLTGSVLDPTNRILPDTKLLLTNLTSKAKYEIRSDATGKFVFVGLPRGQYTLEASLPGFAVFKEDLRVAGNVRRNLELEVGSLQETITVSDGKASPPPSSEAMALKVSEARTRFLELEQRGKAPCAGGVAGPMGGNILPPRKLIDMRPVYPEHLREAKVGGTVTMEALIGTDGTVREVKDVKGPHPDLEAAAAEAVRQWAFSQTMLNCEPIEVRMNVTTNFKSEP